MPGASTNSSIVLPSGTLTVSHSFTNTGVIEIDLIAAESTSIANSTTDLEVSCSFAIASLIAIWLYSSRALTLETNSGSAATNTISLAAGVEYVWTTSSYNTCLITGNVTKLFLTNASGAAADFRARILIDATP